MKAFEYKAVRYGAGYRDLYDIEHELDAWGRDGWELVAIDFGAWIFKREVTE